jgi:hypothetical protein
MYNAHGVLDHLSANVIILKKIRLRVYEKQNRWENREVYEKW